LINGKVTGHTTFFDIEDPIQPEFSIILNKGLTLVEDSLSCICKFNYIEKKEDKEKLKKVNEIFTNNSRFKCNKGYGTLDIDKDPIENRFTIIIAPSNYNEAILDKLKKEKYKNYKNFKFALEYSIRNEYKYWAFFISSIAVLILALFSFCEKIFISISLASIISIMALFLTFKKDDFSIPFSRWVLPLLFLALVVVVISSVNSFDAVINSVSNVTSV